MRSCAQSMQEDDKLGRRQCDQSSIARNHRLRADRLRCRRPHRQQDAPRPSLLIRGRRNGRRAGERQEGRLDHHHDGGHRRQGPVQLPGRQARARQIRDHHPRRGLQLWSARRPWTSPQARARRADIKLAQGANVDLAALQRGMAHQCPGRRPVQGRSCSTARAATPCSASSPPRTTPTNGSRCSPAWAATRPRACRHIRS